MRAAITIRAHLGIGWLTAADRFSSAVSCAPYRCVANICGVVAGVETENTRRRGLAEDVEQMTSAPSVSCDDMTAQSRAIRTFGAALVLGAPVDCVPHDAEKEPTTPAVAAPTSASGPSDGSPPVLVRAEPAEEPSGDAGAELLKTSTLKGPYKRIEAYCQEGPSAHGQAVRCDLQPGAYGRKLSGGTSALLEARLFSFRADLAGTKVSFCRIAV